MFLIDFPHPIRINAIVNQLPPNTCGSASACIVFEKLRLSYDPLSFVANGRDGNTTTEYPEEGSSIVGTAFAMAKTDLVDIEIYWDINIKTNTDIEPYEKLLVDELLKLSNVSIYPSIDIDEIDRKMNDNAIAILAFKRDGIDTNGHFSPFRGINAGTILLLPLNDGKGSCNCSIDVFTSTWWTAKDGRPCILVKKK